MLVVRSGTSLIEVLLALVLVTVATSWALQAAAATERAVGTASARRDAMQRATLTLADVQALPCDTASATRSAREPRWVVSASRSTDARERVNHATVATRRGDTINISRHRWCSP